MTTSIVTRAGGLALPQSFAAECNEAETSPKTYIEHVTLADKDSSTILKY